MSLKHKHNGQEHLRCIFHVDTLEFLKRETLFASVNFVQEDLNFLLGLDTIQEGHVASIFLSKSSFSSHLFLDCAVNRNVTHD